VERARGAQINDVIKNVSLPPSWADKMLAKLEEDREQEAQDGTLFAQNLKSEIFAIDEKLEKLLDAHLDSVISKEEYASKKQKLLNRKVEISEKLADFEHKGNYWLEPMRLFILDSKQAEIISSKDWLEPAFAGSGAVNFVAKPVENPYGFSVSLRLRRARIGFLF